MAKSSQDVRANILALRDELIDNLEFIRTAIRADRQLMEAYFKEHGDLKYRPITGRNTDGTPNGWGTPTEISIEPLASQMRTTVKSLIDSIRVIEGEILPEDDAEGSSSIGTGSEGKRAALRAEFHAQAGGPGATHSEALPEPTESNEPITRTPKEERTPPVVKAEKPAPKDSAAPRPWRETTPRAFPTGGPTLHKPAISTPNVEESKPAPQVKAATNTPIGLSPKLRASLGGSVAASRMEAMRAKYAKKSDDSEE